MRTLKSTIVLLLAVVMYSNVSAQTCDAWTAEKATTWFNAREWAGGLKLNAHESVNKQEFARQYTVNKAYWDEAFAWLKATNLDTIKTGKYVVDGDNVTVSVTEGPDKEFVDTKWESHKLKVDLQYIVKGKEKMGIAPLTKATVVVAFDDKKDVGFYSVPETDSKFYVAEPGTFFLFFPSDAHRPNTKVEGFDKVKKVVVKIKAI
jgi:biofilm protein TabA